MKNKNRIKSLVLRRNVKHPRIEIRNNRIFLILPFWLRNYKKLLEQKEAWIKEKMRIVNETLSKNKNLLNKILLFGEVFEDKEILKKIRNRKEKKKMLSKIKKELKNLIEEIAKEYASKLNVSFNKIFIKNQQTKWGSCSSKGNLTFNIRAAALPKHLISYLVYHEILHLIERRHNSRFLKMIEREFKNYKELEEELNKYWIILNSNVFWKRLLYKN